MCGARPERVAADRAVPGDVPVAADVRGGDRERRHPQVPRHAGTARRRRSWSPRLQLQRPWRQAYHRLVKTLSSLVLALSLLTVGDPRSRRACSRPVPRGSRARRAGAGRLLGGAARAHRRRAPAVRRREPDRRRRGARAPRRPAGLRARRRLERQGSGAAHDAEHDLPHRVADQGDHERRHPGADGGRQARPHRSGEPLHPVVRQARRWPSGTTRRARRPRSCRRSGRSRSAIC